MFWPPDTYPYDEPFDPFERIERIERLRHLVFLDGRLVDCWTERVEGTRYRLLAEDLDAEKRAARHHPEPRPPLHERILLWLDEVVGGRVALLALDDEPLEPLADAEVVDDEVDRLVCRVADELFDAEYLAAARAVLVATRREDPGLLAEAPAAEVAAALCWVVGRANGVVGQRTSVSQKTLKRVLWTNVSPSRRMPRIKACLRGLRAEPDRRPPECPDLLEIGSPAYLTGSTRHRLIVLRDRALVAAERQVADEHAREVMASGSVDSLTP